MDTLIQLLWPIVVGWLTSSFLKSYHTKSFQFESKRGKKIRANSRIIPQLANQSARNAASNSPLALTINHLNVG